jgi:hypothetical protein
MKRARSASSQPKRLNLTTPYRGIPVEITDPPSDAKLPKIPCRSHHRSACSGLKALRNTSNAMRQAAKLYYRFGPLTPSARSANLIAGDGMKNGFPAPNKETSGAAARASCP